MAKKQSQFYKKAKGIQFVCRISYIAGEYSNNGDQEQVICTESSSKIRVIHENGQYGPVRCCLRSQ